MLFSSGQGKREIILESLDFTRVGNLYCILMHTATTVVFFLWWCLLDLQFGEMSCNDLQDYQGGANLYGAPMDQMPAQLGP